MIRRSFIVATATGLQGRPASLLVKTVQRFAGTDVMLTASGRTVNARTLFGVLSLGAGAGASVLVTCTGPREDEAMAALGRLIESDFEEV